MNRSKHDSTRAHLFSPDDISPSPNYGNHKCLQTLPKCLLGEKKIITCSWEPLLYRNRKRGKINGWVFSKGLHRAGGGQGGLISLAFQSCSFLLISLLTLLLFLSSSLFSPFIFSASPFLHFPCSFPLPARIFPSPPLRVLCRPALRAKVHWKAGDCSWQVNDR